MALNKHLTNSFKTTSYTAKNNPFYLIKIAENWKKWKTKQLERFYAFFRVFVKLLIINVL